MTMAIVILIFAGMVFSIELFNVIYRSGWIFVKVIGIIIMILILQNITSGMGDEGYMILQKTLVLFYGYLSLRFAFWLLRGVYSVIKHRILVAYYTILKGIHALKGIK